MSNIYRFIIDTDKYAGNFERELCAYITGCVGECGVGDDMARLFEADGYEPFDNVIEQLDDRGMHRPCTIYPTPGYFSNGWGYEYKDIPENYGPALESYKKAELKWIQKNLASAEQHVLNPPREWTEEDIRNTRLGIRRRKREIKEIEKRTQIDKWPAYLSVAIFFKTRPTKKQIELMKQRAYEFPQVRSGSGKINFNRFEILGFRLEEERTTTLCVPL